ncbi:MAG: hypothetical protein ACRCXA_10475 [Peptostreptococcaceae bacterium]
MNDDQLKEILSEYKVKTASLTQIDKVSNLAKLAMKRKIKTEQFSVLDQLRIQMVYVPKWFYLVHIFIIALYILWGTGEDEKIFTFILFGSSPIFMIPSVVVFYRSIIDGMVELESSCKYSLAKIYAMRLLMVGLFVLVSIIFTCIINGLISRVFNVRALLFSIISFTVTSILILWFGKRKIINGFIAGGIWGVIANIISLSSKGQAILQTINISVSIIILFMVMLFSIFVIKKYLKEITYEGEVKEWNFLSIN